MEHINDEKDGNTAEKLLDENAIDEYPKFKIFEDILVYIGEWGRTQLYLNALLSVSSIPLIMENMAMIFLAGVPRHHCLVDTDDKNWSLPVESIKDGKVVYSQCFMFAANTSGQRNMSNNLTETIPCQRWYYDNSDFDNTIVSEWDLVCDAKWLRAFSTMVYFMGFFIGCLVVSDISDRYGRRRTVLGTSLLMSVSTVAVYFAPNYTVFTVIRCFVGISVGGWINSCVVLRQEWCTARMRIALQTVITVFFVIGLVLFGALAYLIREWRYLALAMAVPKVVGLILSYWFCYPSPRWLLIQGRQQEALDELHRAANRNGRPLPKDFDISTVSVPKRTRGSIIDLVRTPNMRKTTLIVWFTWFTAGLVTYAISYNVGYLAGNIYANFIILKVVLFLRVPITAALHFVNRRVAVMLFAALAATVLLVAMATDESSPIARLILSSAGSLCIGTVFGLIYLYSIEVYPTSIRTIGLGIGSMWARVGTMLSPYVVLLSEVSTVLPFIICGAFGLLISLLFSLVPETRNRPLTDDVEDAEKVNKLSFRLREPKTQNCHKEEIACTMMESNTTGQKI